ncbi:50S ribosome-binding GTPase [Candidatus Woesearchaeota archaeon]|nr:50S ribosome-binding GTPase [Candidatus Woesearchaeota archaeon]
MNFQTLQKVEKSQFYLDVAIRKGKKEAQKIRESIKGDRLKKTVIIESERIKAVGRVLHGELSSIVRNFPKVDELDDFYKELVKCTIDYNKLKKSFGAVNWADQQSERLGRIYYGKIRASKDVKAVYTHKNSYYGRVSSTVNQIKDELEFLESARKILKRFPSIKTGLTTIVIAGFPNVGKTTLLRSITGSEPEIAPYPFTTQGLMIGYANINGKKVQFIDTPGLLDRPLEKRNRIELQSMLALKYLADAIIFVIDPTETCGYDVDEQLQLLEDVRKNFKIKVTIAINKHDISEKQQITYIKEKTEKHEITEISAEKGIGLKELLEKIGQNGFLA